MPKKKKEEKAPADDEDEFTGPPPPPGCKPMMISGKNAIKYGLREEGAGLKETLPSKFFNKEWVMAEVQEIGFYSEFFNFKADIAAYDTEEILVVADPEEVYGESWLIILTDEAKDAQMAEVQARVDAENAAKRAIEEAEAAKKAAEDAILNAVYEDKPVLAAPYESATTADTHGEVADLSERPSRPLLVLGLTRWRKNFGKAVAGVFQDRAEVGSVDCRMAKDPNYGIPGDPNNPGLKRKEVDVGLQGVPPLSEAGTQTAWFRNVNKMTQYEPIAAAEEEMEAQMQAETTISFLRRAAGDMEEALQQNETFDVFQDECKAIGEGEEGIAKAGGSAMKELRTFTDLEFSKNKPLAAVDWHPTRQGEVVVAATTDEEFDERIKRSGKVGTSYLLVWHFTDLIHPQLMLESPHDTYTFRFNPTNPTLVAAGCTSGQVILWDLGDAQEQLRRRKANGGGAVDDDEGGDGRMPPVKHLALSHIDTSHRRPVADLYWLPKGLEVSMKGTIEQTDAVRSYQFMTIAGDGQACIWDVRYKELVKKNPRLFKDIKPNKDGSMPEIPWQPQFKLTLTKLEGVGDLGLGKLDLKCLHANVGEALCSQFFCSTEEGEMVFADFDPPASDDGGAKKSGAEGGAAGGKDDDEDRGAEYVQWMSQPHFRPSVALQRSPFFADVFVDVTDWSFTLWKDGLSTPIFYSPMSNSHFTSGRWSLQRPGVLFISKVDGDIDVWDFTDQSHRASLTLNVAPVAICSIEFSPMLYVISAIRARTQRWRRRISAACLSYTCVSLIQIPP